MDEEVSCPGKSSQVSVAEYDKCPTDITSIELEAGTNSPQLNETEATSINKAPTPTKRDDDDERIAKIEFNCFSCGMNEMVHYFGLDPPFVNGITFREPTYVMRDPFQPPPPRGKGKAEYFIAIGADCSICKKTFCKRAECSFFYTSTYCLQCAWSKFDIFPTEIKQKLRKNCS